MSEQELHIGKLRKIDLQGKTIEEYCELLHNKEESSPLDSYYESYQEYIQSELCDKYIISKGNLYEVIENERMDDCYAYYLKDNKDGTYDYVMSFYNGGICLSECLGKELDKLNKFI